MKRNLNFEVQYTNEPHPNTIVDRDSQQAALVGYLCRCAATAAPNVKR